MRSDPVFRILYFLRVCRSAGCRHQRGSKNTLRRLVQVIRFSVLASSSKANTFHLRAGNTSILIDAGLPISDVSERLTLIGENIMEVQALCISHAHSDHHKAIRAYAEDLQLPIYCSAGTRDALAAIPQLKLPALATHQREPDWRIIADDSVVQIGDLKMISFPVPHDAPEPRGFFFKNGSGSLALATDLGWVDGEAEYWINQASLVYLESNYGADYLQRCSYMQWQKDRISEWHLSNDQAAEVVAAGRDEQRFVLGHLSESSNIYGAVRKLHQFNTQVSVIAPGEQSPVFTI